MLCASTIIRASTKREGTDEVLTLHCGEAYNIRNTVRVVTSFYTGVSYDLILRTIAGFGLSFGLSPTLRIPPEATTNVLLSPLSLNGTLESVLREVTAKAGCVWYIRNGELYIGGREAQPQEYVDAVVLDSPLSTVKGSIEYIDNLDVSLDSGDSVQTKGITLTIPLLANAHLARILQINNHPKYNGNYAITKVQHKLDYEGSTWDTIIEARFI
jgi:hypothetical protein